MAQLNSFEELDCWKVSTDLRRELMTIDNFPEREKYALVSQIRRASRSVTNNIAEGFGRYHFQEFIQFCRISRGSLTELQDHLIIAQDEGFLTAEEANGYRLRIEKALALLNGLIRYLKSQKEGRTEEPSVDYSQTTIKDYPLTYND
jgi:four helix bundle protein